jgi:hypothetical protein
MMIQMPEYTALYLVSLLAHHPTTTDAHQADQEILYFLLQVSFSLPLRVSQRAASPQNGSVFLFEGRRELTRAVGKICVWYRPWALPLPVRTGYIGLFRGKSAHFFLQAPPVAAAQHRKHNCSPPALELTV